MYVVDDLGVLLSPLLLLDGADEVAVRPLLAVGDGELPVAVARAAVVREFGFRRACRANHGRGRTCDDSTLRPRVPR